MINKIIVSVAICASVNTFAQSNKTLTSQLDYCKSESSKLETDLNKYKQFLEVQGKQITELKTKVQNQESEIKNLKSENTRLHNAALSLFALGEEFEKEGKLKEAVAVYKLLIRSYPESIPAVSSKMNIKKIIRKEPSE